MDGQTQYTATRWLMSQPAYEICTWIERPHFLQPALVGVSEHADWTDRQTDQSTVWLHLAVWRCDTDRMARWPTASPLPPTRLDLWILTTWTDDPATQHLLTGLAITDSLHDLCIWWPSSLAAIPLDSDWLTDQDRSMLTLRAALA